MMNPTVRLIIIPLAIIFVSKTPTVSGEAKSPPYFVQQPSSTREILFFVETEDSSTERSFDIPCEAKGDPAPEYIWTKNGQIFNWTSQSDRISQEPGKGTLTIRAPKPNDAGQYQCFAENIWGIATSNSVFARKVELGSFRDEAPAVKQVTEGQPYNLTCQAPGGHPKPNINWLIQDYSGKLIGIDDPRITVDPAGTLWFSNITFDDAIEDSVYACAVTSTHISEVKTGAKVILQVEPMDPSIEENKIAPVQQYTNKKEETVVATKKARLYCIFGGTPLPTITWYKNNKLIQFRNGISLKDSGKSIEIKRATLSDEGNYTCEASNGVGDSLSYSIALKVLVEPRFTKKPESVTIDEEETVEFHCQATGNPPPEILWIHNGKPLSEAPFNPRRAISSNSIVIEKLWKNDTGNYGCNATNTLGYVYQDAYVNVLAEPPNITEFSQDQEIIEGGTVLMRCRAVGSPKPQIIWIRDNVELTNDRFTMTKIGDLTITNVQIADTGEYTCSAQNKISSTNTTVNLAVRQRTGIPAELGPSDTEVQAGGTATLKCSALIDPALELTITWLRDGHPIDFSSQSDQHFVRTNDTFLTIQNTSESDSGMYTCVASTRLDNATAEASLIVQNIPNPPEIVFLTCNARDAEVSWTNMGDNRAPIINYLIQYNTIPDQDTWDVLNTTIPATDTSFKVAKMPWTNYTFRIIAVNKVGNSLPSEPSSVCTSDPDVPYRNPENVTVQATASTTLVMSWEPMPKTTHNGPGFYYNVSWKIDTPEGEWQSQTILEWETNSCTVPNVLPNTEYLATVIAGNNLGQTALPPEILECQTPPDTPFKNPDNVTVRAIEPTTLEISWEPMPISDHNGPGFHYNISWKKDTPETEWQSQTISEWETGYYTVSSVLPYTKYLVTVTARNDLGQASPAPEPSICDTPPDIPFNNPDNVTVHAIDPTTFEISWNPMPMTNHNGPGFYYNISWKSNSSESEWQSQIISEWEKGGYTFNDALPHNTYLITVIAGNDLGQANSTSEPFSFTTPSAIPFKNPDNVTVRATGPITSVVSWKPMPKNEHNGPGFYYNVLWRMDTPEVEWESRIISEWETGEYILDTPPYEKHFVKVIAGNDVGDSIQPPSVVEGYYEEGVPSEAPMNLTLTEILSPTKANISWNRVPKVALRGNFQGYRIETWPEYDQQKGKVTEVIIEQNFNSVVIDKLIPNTRNKIHISVFNGKHEGPFSEDLEIDTPEGVPEPVQFLEAKPLGSSALSLVWEPPSNTNGNLTGYKIHYQTVSGTELGPKIERVPQITDPNETQVKLSDLQPDTNYRITIQATTNAGDGEEFFIEQKTQSRRSLLVQPDFQLEPIDSENSTAVKIIWLPCGADVDTNDCSDQSIGSEFRVEYGLKGETEFEKVTEKNENSVIIQNLQPNKEYEFKVSSIDGTLASESSIKSFKTADIPIIDSYSFASNSEKQMASEQTPDQVETTSDPLEEKISITEPSTTEKNPGPDLIATEIEGVINESRATASFPAWVFLIFSIIVLVIIIILIVVYLNQLNQGNKYIVREQEIKNRRPDCPDDPDYQEVMQPLNKDVPTVDQGSPLKRDKDGMVMIPLN